MAVEKKVIKKYVYMLDDGKMYSIDAPKFSEAVGASWKFMSGKSDRVIAVMSEEAYEKLTGKKLR